MLQIPVTVGMDQRLVPRERPALGKWGLETYSIRSGESQVEVYVRTLWQTRFQTFPRFSYTCECGDNKFWSNFCKISCEKKHDYANFWYIPLWLVPGLDGPWRQKESTVSCYLHAFFPHALTKSLAKASSFFKNYVH